MCGILGIGFQNGCTITNPTLVKYMLRALISETEIRGYDATGVAFADKEEITVLKAPMRASDFIKTKEFANASMEYLQLNKPGGTISVISHCRMKTKGTPADNNNNHPIVTTNIVGIHNGIISNDDKLFNKFQGYNQNFCRRGRVDSEIIFRLIDYFANQQSRPTTEAIQKMSSLVEGSYACAMIERQNPYLLWLFRKTGAMAVRHYDQCGIVVFASLESSIENALQKDGFRKYLGKPSYITVPQNQGICMNLFSNTMSYFKLKTKETVRRCGYDL